MKDIEQENKADILTDRNETVGLLEPILISESSKHRVRLSDLAIELAEKSAGFRYSLPEGVITALADLVRSMNCYYSNLIEGHNTHPIDIERALRNDYNAEPRKRNLQKEALAHITVQKWIDNGGLTEKAISKNSLLEIHRRFYNLVPEALMWSENPETDECKKLIPGQLRSHDVKVGQHVPVSPGAISRFLDRFEQGYKQLGKTDSILAAAAAHHRLLWIHPFLDGNGRVARLMSHAMLIETLNTGGIWSIARGLARNENNYKQQLMNCDSPRRNDLDGRGHLSEEALAEFISFFLETCIDQVDFMKRLVHPDQLRNRILIWAEEEHRAGDLPAQAANILEAILYRGQLPRGDVSQLLATGERNARRITSALLKQEVIVADSPRAPLRLAFPAKLAARWMPGLFPDKVN